MPVSRPDQLPPRDRKVVGIPPFALADDWSAPVALWGATKITLTVGGNPVDVQLSRDVPPAPPAWDDPIPVPVGPWSHLGGFGYVRFRNLTPGLVGTVYGALYAE
jgi:hypothetical protein